MSLQRIVINSPLSAAQFESELQLERKSKHNTLNSIASYFKRIVSGSGPQGADISFLVGAVQASGTFTFSSTGPTNGQTCTIAGVTFTAVTSGATGNQFNINATPATVAANLVTAINAASSLSGIVTASANGAVVTLTAVVPGKMGNGLVQANVNLSNTVVVSFTGGTDGTSYSVDAL